MRSSIGVRRLLHRPRRHRAGACVFLKMHETRRTNIKGRFVSGSTSDRLGRVAECYYREAHKCARGKAYLAAIIMQAAALEAMLQAMCSLYPKDIKSTATYQRKRFRRKRDRALEFTLNQLINIASEAKWFPSKRYTWAGKRTDVAGFTHEVRKVRNLVHPAQWAKERTPMKITKGVYEVSYEILEVTNSWRLHRIEQGLLKSMKAEVRSKRVVRHRIGTPIEIELSS